MTIAKLAISPAALRISCVVGVNSLDAASVTLPNDLPRHKRDFGGIQVTQRSADVTADDELLSNCNLLRSDSWI